MTTAFSVEPGPSRRSGGTAATVAILLITAIGVMALVTAGITFLALAVAFPIAAPIAQQFDVAVSAADIAIAERFAAFSWAFAALAVASLGAAVLVIVKAIQMLDPAPRD